MKNAIKCQWCGKQPVPVIRDRLASHLTAGGLKCVAIGQPVVANNNLAKLKMQLTAQESS